MIHKIKSVQPADDLCLTVTFINGTIKEYNVKPMVESIKDFRPLVDIYALFKQVKVDDNGYSVSWNDKIDLFCEDLWKYGKTIKS